MPGVWKEVVVDMVHDPGIYVAADVLYCGDFKAAGWGETVEHDCCEECHSWEVFGVPPGELLDGEKDWVWNGIHDEEGDAVSFVWCDARIYGCCGLRSWLRAMPHEDRTEAIRKARGNNE